MKLSHILLLALGGFFFFFGAVIIMARREDIERAKAEAARPCDSFREEPLRDLPARCAPVFFACRPEGETTRNNPILYW